MSAAAAAVAADVEAAAPAILATPATLAPSASTAQDEATRVRLGANPATPAGLLLDLASDPSVTVRAAVAMNVGAPGSVDRLLAADDDERVRVLLARKVAGLMPDLNGAEQARLRQQALGTLSALVEDEAVRVRAAIAEVVKEMPDIPRDLILRLAQDAAIRVSDPVIRLSPLLTPEDLLSLLSSPPADHVATAVARRAYLPETVADAVAASADPAAVQALLANRTAAIREATLDALVGRAASHAEWHEPLVTRPNLSVHAARTLSGIVATQLLQVLSERADLDPGTAADLRRRLDARLGHPCPSAPAGATATTDWRGAGATAGDSPEVIAARRLKTAGHLSDDAMLAAARTGQVRQFAAMLAVASGFPLATVDRVTALRSAKGLVSLAWKGGFGVRVAMTAQVLLAGVPPQSALAAGASGDFPLTTDEMRWQLDMLARPGAATAAPVGAPAMVAAL